MNEDELFSKVKITNDGAICLGDSVVCDGFERGYHAAVFTHIHSDHISSSFETCMHQYDVYSSKITGDLLEAMTEDTYLKRTQFHRMDYEEAEMIKCNDRGDFLTLIQSRHMLGSSQVFLETHDRLKIMYSGDISPEDRPRKCDILVIDSTHGNPLFDKVISSESLERRLNDVVIEAIDKKRPVCIHAHRGKLQHIMHMLSKDGNIPKTVPFLSEHVENKIASVYDKNECKISRKLYDISSYEGSKIIGDTYPWIEFSSTPRESEREKRGQMLTISMMGRYGQDTISHNGAKWWIASNEHAEFSELLEYVRNADPHIVVTDNMRTRNGVTLAKEINSKLGIPARPMP